MRSLLRGVTARRARRQVELEAPRLVGGDDDGHALAEATCSV